MNQLLKVAQEFEDKLSHRNKAGELFATYAGMLRGLSIIHQNAHWTSKSKSYYGDHLLFDRLYNESSKHIDSATEKMIGVLGAEYADLEKHMNSAKEFVDDVCNNSKDDLVQRSLTAEETFLEFSKKMYYDISGKTNSMTLGMDDLIMSIANDHEGFVYLLKQRLAE